MASRSKLLLSFALAVFLWPPFAHADTLKITSTPAGASVEINGVTVGTTPYEEQVPGGYFHVDLDPVSKVFTGKISAEIPETAEAPREADLTPEPPLEEVIAHAKPAVVRLKGLGGWGSGFFVTEKGVIATNAHVARGEGSLLAILPGGEQLAADIIHIDTERDIALVKVEGDDFPHLSLAAAGNVRQGETVIAIGNPGDAMPFAVTKGIVSAVGKFSAAGPGIWIQTDATINPGNSGGPLLNARGQVIGINTLKLEKKNVSGIGFALSASDLLAVLLKYYPDPLSPSSKRLLSSPESAAAVKSSATDQAFGTIELREPKAAEVYVDGNFAGDIPWSSPLAAGKYYVIVVKAPGHADWVKRIYVFAGMSTTLRPWPD